ncbi:VPLPA-CTERM sorting domain-containing protein [Puniceibacterium confluentis]|uniref:VPLPA-CTERM sorting domain-containing protein n=1 Tax=Puniceibacterium confluentis TaxID=1958944 RepID=UPI0016455556|nr:VPLPA-CTERM sorting domain-containing protein [Puniceibacterium confluentis]
MISSLKTSLKVLSLGLAALIATPAFVSEARAAAVAIDFTALAAGTTVTDQYDNVTFSLSGGPASGDAQISTYGGGLSNSPLAGLYPTANNLVATFAAPVSALSFTFETHGDNGVSNYQVLGAGAAVLASGLLSSNASTVYSFAGLTGIQSVIWSNGMGPLSSWTQSLSTLNYETASAVPLPAAMPLLALALGAFGIAGRRRKASQA